jgi:hypothetical protein
MFDRIDTNEDGVIDATEMKALADRIAARTRGGEAEAEVESGEAEAQAESEETATAEAESGEPEEAESQAQAEATQAEAEAEATDDPITGTWAAQIVSEQMQNEFTLTLKLGEEGDVTGTLVSSINDGPISEGKWDADAKRLTFSFVGEQGSFDFVATMSGGALSGDIEVAGGAFSMGFTARRTAGEGAVAAEEKPEVVGETIDTLVPGPRWVSAIEPSKHEPGRVYISLDGHRSNDDEPYLFCSDDYGLHWTSIRGNLPTSAGSTRTIREDIQNPNVLYTGCEFGIWVSIDRGKTWTRFNGNLPTVAVHEIAQHPTSGEIVVATHGRSLWALDVTPIRQMTDETLEDAVHLFLPNSESYWKSEPSRGGTNRRFVGQNPTESAQIYYMINERPNRLELRVIDETGEVVHEFEPSSEPGLHVMTWNLRKPPPANQRRRRFRRGVRVDPGTYVVEMRFNNQTLTQPLEVRGDPEYPNAILWGEAYERRLELEEKILGGDEEGESSEDERPWD